MAVAAAAASLSIAAGGYHSRNTDLPVSKHKQSGGYTCKLAIHQKTNRTNNHWNLSVCAEYRSLNRLSRASLQRLYSPRCSMGLSIGGGTDAGAGGFNFQVPKFPRIYVRDPYKLLGVSRDASEEEIRGARNFLLQQYAGHEQSEEAIEGAYEKIIMKSFWERKKSKINLKSRLKKQVEESPSWVKTLLGYFELPPMDIILKRLFLFGFMAGWSMMTSAETGPAFQVALSLFSCIFFLNDKMKNMLRASITGFGALVVGWLIGSVMIPVMPLSLFPPTWSLELLTSLVVYIFLFLGCTFLK